MIRHIALYTYKPSVTESELKQLYKRLDEISAKLPGRLSYTWGPYSSHEGRNRGYTHALIVDFQDEKARDLFLTDPERAHFSIQEVLPRMVDGVNSIVSFDFTPQE